MSTVPKENDLLLKVAAFMADLPDGPTRYYLTNMKEEIERLNALINSPHTADFLEAMRTEAAHQRERWAASHDGGKTDADWFWLIGHLGGKAVNAGTLAVMLGQDETHHRDKRLHHIITTAAACLNWHAARTGADTRMRPGIEEPTS